MFSMMMKKRYYEAESSFNPMTLKGKVALLTGGASLICQAIARIFIKHGANVAISGRNATRLQKVTQKLKEETNVEIISIQMDVRSVDQVYAGVKKVKKTFGRIDILINAAAGNFLCPFESLSPKGFRTIMEIDALGAFNVSKAVFDICFSNQPSIQEENILSEDLNEKDSEGNEAVIHENGIIINISSTIYYAGTLLQCHAGAAKAAVDALTKHLAVELGPRKIRVNGIAPGPIEGTEGLSRLNPFTNTPTSKEFDHLELVNKKSGGEKDEPIEIMRSFIPLQRLGIPEDIAYAALFLCIPESSLITGVTLVVDGGQSLTCANFTVLEPHVRYAWKNLQWKSKL